MFTTKRRAHLRVNCLLWHKWETTCLHVCYGFHWLSVFLSSKSSEIVVGVIVVVLPSPFSWVGTIFKPLVIARVTLKQYVTVEVVLVWCSRRSPQPWRYSVQQHDLECHSAFLQQFYKLCLVDRIKKTTLWFVCLFNHLFGSTSTNSSTTGPVQDCC